MSEATQARLARASRAYMRMKPQFEAVRAELAAAIVEERREGTLIEDLTAKVPYRQTQVNRILEKAGMTEKRAQRGVPAGDS